MDLKPIRRKRLSESAIDEIKRFIESNNLKEGDQLPSERELVEKLQISRSSLREALRMLEITGLVEVRPGRGIFVRDLTGDLFVPLESWISSNKEAIYKHFEARLILEPEIAALAARRINGPFLERIAKNIEHQERLADEEVVPIIRADIEFHRLIAEAAGNETISMLMNSLAKISFQGWKAALRVEGRNRSAVREHKQLLQLLEEGDEKGSRDRMREHMLASMKLLKEQGLDKIE